PDEIVSMVLVRDLIKNIVSGELDIPISDLGQEPLYTPSNTTIDELVRKLKLKSIHLAVVVDEHGAMIGVVSLEDMLEELVGEIYDETDEKPNDLMVLGGGKVLVQGTAELRVVEEHYDMDIPGKPTDTINRWLLKHTERIPEKDEKFELDGFEVRVQDASLRRIHQVVLRRITASQDDLTADVQDSS
ncbi:MAG: transporter associated domain-containing protein, partial [Candidatus Thiodiazotropha endolucinida]